MNGASSLQAVTHAQHLIAVIGIAVCWGAFGLAWIVGALYNASRGPRRSTRASLRPFALVGVIGSAILLAIFRLVPADGWHALGVDSPWATGIGLVVLIAATAFTLWARFALGTMWSWDPEVKMGHVLRTDGPYDITRHPIYTGILGMLLGSLLLAGVGPWLLILAAGFVFLEIKIHVEEELMLATFPAEYRRYRERVPQLIPGLRSGRRGGERAPRTPQVRP